MDQQRTVLMKRFKLGILVCSLALIHETSYALSLLEDQELSEVNGQDGVELSLQFGTHDQQANTSTGINIDRLHWSDQVGSIAGEKTLQASAHDIKIRALDPATKPLGLKLALDMGSNASGNIGLDLNMNLNPMLISVDQFKLCSTAAGACASALSLGHLGVQVTDNTGLHFKTNDGLFNADVQAEANITLRNTNIYLGQDVFANATKVNQFLLRNFNFDLNAKGFIYIHPTQGFMLSTNKNIDLNNLSTLAALTSTPNANFGYADLNRVKDSGSAFLNNNGTYGNGLTGANGVTTNSGLNLEFMLKKDVDKNNLYELNPNNKLPANANGLLRVGASGRLVNTFLQVRGTNATGVASPTDINYGNVAGTNILGYANTIGSQTTSSIIGSTGIGTRLYTQFTREDDSMLMGGGTPTTLEIGGAGINTYGFEFSKITGILPTTRGYFDSGNIYINLVDTKSLLLPQNYYLRTSRFGNGNVLASAADYTQNIFSGVGANPFSLVLATRGTHFQAFSRRGKFTHSTNVNPANAFTNSTLNKWGLALPFYNVNTNMAIYAANPAANTVAYYNKAGVRTPINTSSTGNQRLGFSLGMTADGMNRNASGVVQGPETTSVLVLDADNNYYLGLRNIDMLLKGSGSIGIENQSLNVSLPEVLIVMAGQLAAGKMPNNYVACQGGAVNCTSFNTNNDVLAGLKLRLDGSMEFSLLPNNSIDNGTALDVVGELTIAKGKTGNTLQIVDPIDESTLGLDDITGKVRFNNAIRISRNPSGDGVVHFDASLRFNPNNSSSEVIQIKNVNLYPATSGAGKRLGEMTITGGRLNSNLAIIPRN